MLEDIRRQYVICADAYVPNWQTANKNDLINNYILNEKIPYLRDGYFSAIVLRYWGNIGKHYLSSKASGFSIEDCYDMLLDGILYILEKRKWLDPNSKYFNDKNAPDKMMNRAIYSSRQLRYYLANRDKRKANYGKSSLDQMEENLNDHISFMEDTYTSDDFEKSVKSLDFDFFIMSYFNTKKLLSGLVLHSIYYDDCFSEKTLTKKTEEGKYKSLQATFKLNKLVTNILSYNKKDIKSISQRYQINDSDLCQVIDSLKSSKKLKVNKLFKSVLDNLSKDKELKEFLCY